MFSQTRQRPTTICSTAVQLVSTTIILDTIRHGKSVSVRGGKSRAVNNKQRVPAAIHDFFAKQSHSVLLQQSPRTHKREFVLIVGPADLRIVGISDVLAHSLDTHHY